MLRSEITHCAQRAAQDTDKLNYLGIGKNLKLFGHDRTLLPLRKYIHRTVPSTSPFLFLTLSPISSSPDTHPSLLLLIFLNNSPKFPNLSPPRSSS